MASCRTQIYNPFVLDDEIRSQSLTIYLAKEAIANPRDMVSAHGALAGFPIGPDGTYGTLYVQRHVPKPPKWARFFDRFLSSSIFGDINSAGALVIVQWGERLFALTFGTGRFLLKSESLEERFGLRVALNCIGNGTVKTLDKETLDPIARKSREQASRTATASEFGLDVEQDLLKAVTGEPSEAGFGKWVQGMDSLHLSMPVEIETLSGLLERVYEKHLDTSYKRIFPWVDHINQVRDAAELEQLNSLLAERLRKRQKDNMWMAVPEVIQWADVDGFRFPGVGSQIGHPDIHLDDFLESFSEKAPISERLLHARTVECLDCNGEVLHKWKAVKCLYCELEWNGNAYLLSGGSWYRVQQDFVSQVNDAYNTIPDYDMPLPEYDAASEGEYTKGYVRTSPETLALLDSELVTYSTGTTPIEFCDVMTATKDLIHIKRYGQSAALSHLFAQGLVAGELFQTDPEFRRAVNLKLPVTHKLADPGKRPLQEEYRIVFAIISDRPGMLTLPFFSRINLKHAARRLQGYGFRVAKAKILVAEGRAKLKKVRSRKKAA